MIRELKPDVLHTHTAKAGAVGRIAARLAGADRPRAVVHTFHGHVLQRLLRHRPTTAAFRQVERTLARSTDALIAVSPEVRDDLVALGVAPAERITVVRLGLDLDARTTRAAPARASEERARLGVPPDRFAVGWLGRMTDIKRVDVLLDAFADSAAAASTRRSCSSATGRFGLSSSSRRPTSASPTRRISSATAQTSRRSTRRSTRSRSRRRTRERRSR